jgi:hypothetical protein
MTHSVVSLWISRTASCGAGDVHEDFTPVLARPMSQRDLAMLAR